MDKNRALNEFIATLRGMNNEVCDTAATSMEANLHRKSALNLHLRKARLNTSDALVLASALKRLSQNPDTTPISSFSVSYNRELGDVGTTAIAQSMPRTIQEIGFVDCNFGDEGALALLDWAEQSPSVNMICIEQNNLSANARSLYEKYRQNHPGATVIF